MTAQPTAAAVGPSAPLVAAARLRGDTSQRVFDVLLRCLAEPGTVHRLPSLPPEVSGPAWLALALADVDVAVAVIGVEGGAGAEGTTAELIRRATDAAIVGVTDAAIVVSLAQPGTALADVAIGTALAPEDGARVALAVEHVDTVDGTGEKPVDGTALTLSGPGVPGERTVVVHGLDQAAVAHLGNVDGRFPTGFDTWLFTPGGEVMAISRSTTVRMAAGTESGWMNDADDTERSAASADQNRRS